MLKGLTIIELASVLAGPAVGQFFTELGARVIKIENATTQGDVTRQWKVGTEDKQKEDSAYYRCVNFGKEVRMLNLKVEQDRQVVYDLLKTADVVISNFPTTAARNLGMDVERIAQLNPGIIFAQLYAFGAEDERPAYDIVLQAEAGFLGMTGTKTGELCRMPVALIDLLAAHQLKEGILLALLQKARTGKGALVTTNLYASALASLANQATNYLIAEHIPTPMGTAHPNIAPYGDIFTLIGGEQIVLAIGSDRQFLTFCSLLEIVPPAHLGTNKGRVMHRREMVAFLNEAIVRCELAALLQLCKSNKIPIGQIKRMDEVFAEKAAQDQLLTYSDGQQIVKTVAFEIASF